MVRSGDMQIRATVLGKEEEKNTYSEMVVARGTFGGWGSCDL